MAPPANSLYIIQGEMNIVVTAMKKGIKWSSHVYQEVEDSLTRNFTELKRLLIKTLDFGDLEPNDFLEPFLKVIRSGDTSGPVTGLALSSLNKFLAYGLIDVNGKSAASAVENITDAVTHARFVGTDPGSDEVVLMKILQVLRTLLLTPAGVLLSNDSICEIMQSCFRICFEMRLSELLRKSAESALVDMAQLLFVRLPHFKDDNSVGNGVHKLKMRPSAGIDNSRTISKKKSPRSKHKKFSQGVAEVVPANGDRTCMSLELTVDTVSGTDSNVTTPKESTTPPTTPFETPIKEMDGPPSLDDSSSLAEVEISDTSGAGGGGVVDMQENLQATVEKSTDLVSETSNSDKETQPPTVDKTQEDDFINPRGVRFIPPPHGKEGPLIPYGLPCVRELFRFLISLINPLDKQNSEVMIQIGLNLITVALETNAHCIGRFPSLLALVKDELCRYAFELINSDRISLFTVALRVCFLLFESLRPHLKFQLEMYLNKLMGIITSESPKIVYEQREAILDTIVQLWRIPGFVTELYLNYDCDLYCSNVFEELTKILSKNTFPISGIYTAHLLSLTSLLTVTESIKNHCLHKIVDGSGSQRVDTTHSLTDSKRELFTNLNESLRQQQAASGYLFGVKVEDSLSAQLSSGNLISESDKILPVAKSVPSHGDLVKIKHKKSLLITGAEQFNSKPVRGIQFLQENGILNPEFDPVEVSSFLKENSRLDKKMIGEYVSNRKNLKVLETFVKSFNFDDTRIDEALRMYLETFRLPGEAPVISLLLEHFAEHWHKMNGEPFANSDAAFTLAYAVIMLNVDQHNHNVKKQSIPMTLEEFKKNLTKVNGGKDFEAEMLEEIYSSIRNEEIVMPAEHTGLVKENYLWKMLIRKGMTKDGLFIRAKDGEFDRELFTLIWGPTVAALSFVFDKSLEKDIIETTIEGFRTCAIIAAHFGMCDVFDHLIISVCKFTTLLNSTELPDALPVSFGHNVKAQLAATTVFDLAHQHGDIIREGWRNILDCLQQLYYAKLLPNSVVEAEDFVNPTGKISLMREETPIQRSEVGLFSSFYSYITLTADSQVQKGMTQEDQESAYRAQKCILKCHPERLISESKFLRADSLQELVKALIYASPGPDSHASQSGAYDEYTTIFFLELLVEIVLHNRDRVNVVWQGVRDHIYSLMMGSSATEHFFLMERTVVSILRLAVRLLWREDMTAQVLQSLKMLLLLKPPNSLKVSRQIAFALHELLKSNAANIHTTQDWTTLFTLIEYFGAGAKPTRCIDDLIQDVVDSTSENGVQSDSDVTSEALRQDEVKVYDRGYTSDSELYEAHSGKNHMKINVELSSGQLSPENVKKDFAANGNIDRIAVNQFDIVLKKDFTAHDTVAFLKCCESLAFLIRDVAHITPANLESCIYSLRTFSEASLNGGKHYLEKRSTKFENKERKFTHRLSGRRKDDVSKVKRSISSGQVAQLADDDDTQSLDGGYLQASIQLLDLMHTLHTRACPIVTSWADEETYDRRNENDSSQVNEMGNLWSKYWCPLLQGIARLCCDSRRQVRTAAVTYLQRALLVHDLQTLSAIEWETCFNKVLFPLLLKLLENISPNDPSGLEETRMRGATLLCKVFLQHLTPLLSLSTFTALFLTILDFMDKYMHADKSDLLCEAIPESLKNMLLVMDTAGIFSTGSGHSQLWVITWDRIDAFLPGLKEEVFRSHQRVEVKSPEPERPTPPDLAVETPPSSVEDSAVSKSSCVVDLSEVEDVLPSDLVDSEQNVCAPPQSNDSQNLDTQTQAVSSPSSPPKGTSTLIDQGQQLQQQLPLSVLRVQEQGMNAVPAKSIPLVISREIFNSAAPISVVNQSSAVDQGNST